MFAIIMLLDELLEKEHYF